MITEQLQFESFAAAVRDRTPKGARADRAGGRWPVLLLGAGLLLGSGLTAGLLSGCARPPQPQEARTMPRSGTSLAARHLPRSTYLLAVGRNLKALDALADTLVLGDELRSQREVLAYQSIKELDWDITSLGDYERVGIDVNAPVAFAVVPTADRGDESMVVALQLRDPALFKSAMYRLMQRHRSGRLKPSVVGDALIAGRGRSALVLRDGSGYWVYGRAAQTTALELASVADDTALASAAGYQQAQRSNGARGAVWLYFQPRALLYYNNGLDPRWAGADYASAARAIEHSQRQALTAARARGADLEAFVAIDRDHRQALNDLRDDEHATLQRRWYGSLGAASANVRINKHGVRLLARIQVPSDAQLWRLFAPAKQHLASVPVGGVGIAGAIDPALLLGMGEANPLLAFFGARLDDGLSKSATAGWDGSFLVHAAAPSDVNGAAPALAAGGRFGVADRTQAQALVDRLREPDAIPADVEGIDFRPRLEADALVFGNVEWPAPVPYAAAEGTLSLHARVDVSAMLGWLTASDEAPTTVVLAPAVDDAPPPPSPSPSPSPQRLEAVRAKRAAIAALETAIADERKHLRRKQAERLADLGEMELKLRRAEQALVVEANYRNAKLSLGEIVQRFAVRERFSASQLWHMQDELHGLRAELEVLEAPPKPPPPEADEPTVLPPLKL